MKTIINRFVLSLLLTLLTQQAWAQHTDAFHASPLSTEKKTSDINEDRSLFELDTQDLISYVQSHHETFTLHMKFGQVYDWDMVVTPNELRSPDYRLRTSNGITISSAEPPVTYKGVLREQPESQIRLTISDGYIKAFILNDKGQHVYVESVDGNEEPSTRASILAVSQPNDQRLGACEHEMPKATAPNQISSTNSQAKASYVAEMAMIVDRLAFEQASSLEALERELLTTLNFTEAYYAQHEISYQLTEIYVATDLASQPWGEYQDAGDMLSVINDWAEDGGLGHHDIGTFWTGIEYGYSFAWVNTIGTKYKQHLVEYQGAGGERWGANLQSHEAGHTWGASHVEHNREWIMSPVIYDGELNWSSDIVAQFPSYIDQARAHLEEASGLTAWISQISIGDDDNANGKLDAGESADFVTNVSNTGDTPLENMTVRISGLDDETNGVLSISNDAITINRLEGNDSVQVQHPISIAANAEANSTLTLLYHIAAGSESIEFIRTIQVGDSQPVSVESPTSFPFVLEPGYPNPFAHTTTIPFSLSESAHVKLFVYDALGRVVETLVDEILPPGNHQATWAPGQIVSGHYFYRLESNSFSKSHSLILSR